MATRKLTPMLEPALTQWLTDVDGLASELRAARNKLNMQGNTLAKHLGWAPSKISRLENGDRLPSSKDVRQWAVACGLDTAATDALVEKAEEADALHTKFRNRLPGQGDDWANYDALYRESSHLFLFSTSVLPPVVQFENYALEAITQATELAGTRANHATAGARVVGTTKRAHDDDDPSPETSTAQLLHRQEYLQNPAKTWELYLLEQALHQSPTTNAALARSLEKLLNAAEQPNVEVGIVPARDQTKLPQLPPFGLFDRRLVVVELAHGDVVLLDNDVLATYLEAVNLLKAAALTGTDATDAIGQALTELNGGR